jgi:hypothetical protein
MFRGLPPKRSAVYENVAEHWVLLTYDTNSHRVETVCSRDKAPFQFFREVGFGTGPISSLRRI